MSKQPTSNRRVSRQASTRSPAAILTANAKRRKGVKTMHTIKIDNRLYAEIVRAAEDAGQTVDEYVAEWLWSGVDSAKPTLGIPTAR